MRSEHAGGIAGRKTGAISAATIVLNVEKNVAKIVPTGERIASTDGKAGGRTASSSEKIVARPYRNAVAKTAQNVVSSVGIFKSGVENLGWSDGIVPPPPVPNARVDRVSSSARGAIVQAPAGAARGALSAVIADAEAVKAKASASIESP
jgi:hypothetical protein